MDEKNNAVVISGSVNSVKKTMTVDELNEFNLGLSTLIKSLDNFSGIDITAAVKQLKEAGKSLSQHFYNYQQKYENKND